MKRIVALALTLSILGLGTGLAQAAEITTIKYSLAGSIQNVTAPLAGANPAGGMMTLQFTDFTVNSMVDVSASIQLLTMSITVNPLIVAIVTGSLNIFLTQIAVGGHMIGPHTALGPFAGSIAGVGTQNGFIHCLASAGACLALANLPSTQIIPIPATNIPFPITIPNLGPNGTPLSPNPINFLVSNLSQFTAIRPFGGGLATGSFQLVGNEISRSKIVTPEPGILPMVLLGALGLAGSVAWTRRRAR